MIISENYFGKENCVAYGDVLIRRNYEVIKADEHFYHFAGKVMGINFLDVLHPDNIRDFRAVFDTLKPGQKSRMIILLRNGIGEYFWSDMTLSNSGKKLSGNDVIEARCFFLSAVESRYIMARDNLNKYRTLLSLYKNYLFDYNSKTGIFSLYLYRGNQCSSPVKCDLEQLKERTQALFKNETEKKEFACFYNYLKSGSKSFNCIVSLPLNENCDELHRFKANGDSLFSEDKYVITAGYLEMVDSNVNDVVPYYATQEAVDSGTGLLNKKACIEYTREVITSEDNKVHYMIIFDVDNFKTINDNYGHLFGDEVLNKVAGIINSNLNGRGIAGRFGGDEFYIFTNNINTEEDLRVLLTTMRKELQFAFEDRLEDFKLTLSIGVSLFPKDGTDYEELFKKADKCLYLAKSKGKNRFIIYDENKHGTIETNELHVHKVLDLSEHAEYMSGVISDMILRIMSQGKSVLDDVMKNLLEQIEIDGVRIYDEEAELVYQFGEYKKIPDMKSILSNETFLNRYNKNNLVSIGSVYSVEAWYKEFYTMLSDCNIMAFLSVWFEVNGSRYYFFYDVFNHNNRLNDSHKNMLIILSKIIASVL